VNRDQALVLTCTLVLLLGVGVSLIRVEERSGVLLPTDKQTHTQTPGKIQQSANPWRARSLTPVPNINPEAEPQAARARP
jgi:hypothetical protein